MTNFPQTGRNCLTVKELREFIEKHMHPMRPYFFTGHEIGLLKKMVKPRRLSKPAVGAVKKRRIVK